MNKINTGLVDAAIPEVMEQRLCKEYHPTQQQMQIVIDNLRSIEEEANMEGCFDIEEGVIKERDSTVCNTVMCVAGWYAMATIYKDDHPPYSERWVYSTGVELIAETLTLDGEVGLEEWADNNPTIWGNPYGYDMFSDVGAYNGLAHNSEKPMSIIIAHLEAVKTRLPLRGSHV